MSTIEVRGLHKRYGEIHAVRGIDLDIEAGEVVALLGPNGAGKSTTVEILEGHRTPSEGSVRVLGMDPATGGREFRDRIGIVLQQSGIEDELTVAEALEVYSSAYADPAPPDEVLELVGLTEAEGQRVSKLSGGQQRRIDLALGIIGRPEILFLDEPTTGFDPAARRRSWELITRLRSLGTTILLTTHYMDEAQNLADRVIVIVGGEIVASGTPDALMDQAGDTIVRFRLPGGSTVADLPGSLGTPTTEGDEIVVSTATPTPVLHALTGWSIDQGIDLLDLRVDRPSLEEVYLDLADPGAPEAEA